MRANGVVSVLAIVAVGLVGIVPAATARDARPPCTISGTPGPDVLRGTPHRDVICAGAGDDVVYAGGGDDVVRGGPGDDELHGGPGHDTLIGGPGRDRLDQGAGLGSYSHAHVELRRVYQRLPTGTLVRFAYRPERGSCLSDWNNGWTEDIDNRPETMYLMDTRHGLLTSCEDQPGEATYDVTVTLPSGQVATTWFDVYDRSDGKVEVECPKTVLRCYGGEDFIDDDHVSRPRVTIGPIQPL